MAPTRPSIMSDGATMSQPAAPGTTACRQSTSTVSSLRISAVADQAVVTEAVERIERHVADDANSGIRGLDGAHGAADEVVGIERLGGSGGLQRCRDRTETRRRPGMPSATASSTASSRQIDRQPFDTRHRGDRLAPRVALDDEHRPDQIGCVEAVLGHQPPRPGVRRCAAQAGARVAAEMASAAIGGVAHAASSACVEIGQDVVDVLDADRQPDVTLGDAGRQPVFERKLRVRRRRRMDRQRPRVADVGDVIDQLQRIDEPPPGLAAALQLEARPARRGRPSGRRRRAAAPRRAAWPG